MTLYPPPSPPVFPAGYDPLPADLDGWVQATLGFQTTSIAFRAALSSGQSLSAGNNVLDFDTVIEDPYSGWNPGTFKWIAPWTGWYEVTVTGSIATGSAVIAALVTTSSGTVQGSCVEAIFSPYPAITSASQVVHLLDGEYIQGAINVSAAATTATGSGQQPTMEISFVSK